MRGFKLVGFVILLGSALVGLCLSLVSETGKMAAYTSAFYAVLVTLFLLAQIYGFVLSQVKYEENVESVKYTMLENELKDEDQTVFSLSIRDGV